MIGVSVWSGNLEVVQGLIVGRGRRSSGVTGVSMGDGWRLWSRQTRVVPGVLSQGTVFPGVLGRGRYRKFVVCGVPRSDRDGGWCGSLQEERERTGQIHVRCGKRLNRPPPGVSGVPVRSGGTRSLVYTVHRLNGRHPCSGIWTVSRP